MAEFMFLLLMWALFRAIFFSWGNRAVCYDILGMGKASGGGGGQIQSSPTYTVSPGLAATPFGHSGGGGGGVGSPGSFASPTGTTAGTPGAVSASGVSSGASLGGSSVGRSPSPSNDATAAATFTSQPDGTHVLNIPNGGIYFLGAPSQTPNSVGSSTGRSSNPASSTNFLGIGGNKG